jgi:hypothetical protein
LGGLRVGMLTKRGVRSRSDNYRYILLEEM